ncbi:glycosyltransferase [Balneola sp. MJW-20]|uniref:glycosyltransferase n=1 Tax=Gracilimonas aurantiaca TaxID=3234185 RepID=UPI003467783F
MVKSLSEIFSEIDPDIKKIYVVPLIRYSHKRSDYLYLLYQDLIESDTYDIESISVFNHFSLVTGIWKNKSAILHYHWLEFQDLKSFFGMPWKLLCIWLFKAFGGKIVWTIHNEFPHDRRFLLLHKLLHKKMAKWAEILHVHCKTAIRIMNPRLKVDESKYRVMEHPLYPAKQLSRSTAIEHLKNELSLVLNPNHPVILMFGNISEYKQINQVVDIVLRSGPNVQLLIAGPVKKGNMSLFKKLQNKAKKASIISLYPHFVSEEQVPWFFSASDLCVFNYREILSSGGVQMARSHAKKILAPNKGCLSELSDKPNIQLFNSEIELEEKLNEFIRNFGNA